MNAEPRKVRGHIPWEAVDARLTAATSVLIISTRPDGRPHAAPVWYLWTGSAVYFATRTESVKGKNLGDGAWIVAHFGDADDVLYMDGPVVKVTDTDEQTSVDRDYTAKHLDPTTGEHYGIWAVKGNALFRLDPRRIVTWNDGQARGRTEWRFD
jgi:hypothetical protein